MMYLNMFKKEKGRDLYFLFINHERTRIMDINKPNDTAKLGYVEILHLSESRV